MKVLVAGHRYELELFEPEEHVARMHGHAQVVQFVQKEPVREGAKEMRTVAAGTSTEEVLDMVIDRMSFLQERMPCEENEQAISHVREARGILWQRTARRKAARIEGQYVEEQPETPSDVQAPDGSEAQNEQTD